MHTCALCVSESARRIGLLARARECMARSRWMRPTWDVYLYLLRGCEFFATWHTRECVPLHMSSALLFAVVGVRELHAPTAGTSERMRMRREGERKGERKARGHEGWSSSPGPCSAPIESKHALRELMSVVSDSRLPRRERERERERGMRLQAGGQEGS